MKAARNKEVSYVDDATRGRTLMSFWSLSIVIGYLAGLQGADLEKPFKSFLTKKESVGSDQLFKW